MVGKFIGNLSANYDILYDRQVIGILVLNLYGRQVIGKFTGNLSAS
jgi:hypothetical protein